MRIHIISYDKGVWNVFVNGQFISKKTNNEGIKILKPGIEWTSDDEKKVAYDWKARNILKRIN
jgi:hypothetical protein